MDCAYDSVACIVAGTSKDVLKIGQSLRWFRKCKVLINEFLIETCLDEVDKLKYIH